jgi:hypothetical protein
MILEGLNVLYFLFRVVSRYTAITKGTGKPVTNVDTFEYPTALVKLPAEAMASL